MRKEKSKVLNNKVLPSVCPLDCPDTCSLSVTVENDRIIDVRGSKANPFTMGALCAKVVKSYPEFVHGENRLRYPLKRTGSKGGHSFERINWDEALDLVHVNVQRVIDTYGAQAVVPFNYAGPHGRLAGGSMDRRFFYKLGASRLQRGPLCAGTQSLAYDSLYGSIPGMSPDDVKYAKLIVVWGVNVTVSNLHMQRVIQAARRRGAKLVVIDPRQTKVAKQADLHLPLRPGTDVILALAVAAQLECIGGIDTKFVAQWVSGFDQYMQCARDISLAYAAQECGLEEGVISQFAMLYHQLSPAAIMTGVSLERNRNGGACIRAAASLPALTGKFGVRGGGVVFSAGNAFPVTDDRLQGADLIDQSTRCLNILDIPNHILATKNQIPVKALFIYNHNPLSVHPDQNRMKLALAQDDLFIVGCDVVMTDSLAYADVILPACSHFEHADIYASYGHMYLQRADPVISPVGEALPNTEIFRRLAARFGFDGDAFTVDDKTLIDQSLDADDRRMNGLKASELPLQFALEMCIDGDTPRLFENIFPATPSGKVELFSSALAEQYGQGLPGYRKLESDYPLTLITPASDKRINATFGGVSACVGSEELQMHPHDARVRNLEDGTEVRVWNDLGEVNLCLKITDTIRQDVVCSAKNPWLKTSKTGQTTNALISSARSDIADGACYNDARVEVSAIPD